MKRVLLIALKKNEVTKAGYEKDFLAHGTVTGSFLHMEDSEYKKLISKWHPVIGAQPQGIRGAGDIVAKVAQPIAKTIDKVFKTNVSGCGGCKARQDALNKLLPIK
jgi:hypothetical protein